MLRNGRLQRATAALCATTSASLVGSVRAEGTNTTSSHRVDAMGRPRPMMFVRDPDAFARKWKKFSTDGIEKLVVIADFDFTLTTRFKADGGQGESTHGVLTRSEALGGSASQISEGHFRKYYPIEQSVTLSNAEKLPYIVEWWTKEHEVLVDHKLTHQMIGRAVAKSEVALRQGFMEIFDVLADEDVPTLIFSAGLYDVIHAVLDKEYAKTERKTLPKNVHVVSNMMRFDPTGLLVGFQGNIIHSLNKNASVVLDTPFWKKCQLQKRENILLLGDSLTDATMTEGLDCSDDNIVRIGFLNDHVDERLDTYLKTFDVVLTHDSSLFPVELMLHQLDRVGPKQHDETKSS
ncbi:hypothetical protein Poli38472_009484 [Pythium oligandrum]|uniref:5'-nucleotidase n=1 Tax=Pythium oligandrum TaxID=41045 RepID=A0A8K1CFP4_PYTOL|nr:hypothetical protein Poli38472_009484 [Pythium oligandrum]|eukprot:TMW61991.1 hypothetical protein Poli38472_009484 [Pythium oligandrum]